MKKLSILAAILAATVLGGAGCSGNPNAPLPTSDTGGNGGQETSGGSGEGGTGGSTSGGGETPTETQSLRAAREGDRFLQMGWFRLAEAAYRVAVELGAGPETVRLRALARRMIEAAGTDGASAPGHSFEIDVPKDQSGDR